MKRSPQQELTKEVLLTGEIPIPQEQLKESTPEQIAQRRILKIRSVKNDEAKPANLESNEKEKTAGFKLTEQLSLPKEQKPLLTGGLFGPTPSVNLFSQPPTGGLFGNLQGAKSAQPTGGLFGNLQPGQSLFGNPNPSGHGLFGALPDGWKKSGPAEDEDDDGEEEGGDEPLESKSDDGNPGESKVTFEYKMDFEKLINIGINKFRVNSQDPSLQGFLSIEKLKDNRDQFIIVYRNATKLILHQGIILKITQFSNFNNREDCLQMNSYEFVEMKEEEKKEEEKEKEKVKEGEEGKESQKEKTSQKKLQKNILKIMFKNKDECKEFTTALQTAIDQLKKSE